MVAFAFTLAAFAAGAGFASAQSLSSACISALTSVAANPDASACLNPSALVTLAVGSGNTSVVGPITNWLTGLCSAAPCSNNTLSAIVTNVTTGCNTELSTFGVSSSDTSSIISTVQLVYPTIRKVACLNDDSTKQLCIPETLNNIQDIVGPLSINNVVSVIAGGNVNIPSNVTCTSCTKAAYNIINQDLPSLVAGGSSAIQSECGASFVDGATPSGISQSASTTAAQTKVNAASLSLASIGGVAVSALSIVLTMSAML